MIKWIDVYTQSPEIGDEVLVLFGNQNPNKEDPEISLGHWNGKWFSDKLLQNLFTKYWFPITCKSHLVINQPERSKREDSQKCEMRCSEHCGNTVRDK